MFVELYTKSQCSYCVQAKNLLEREMIGAEITDVSAGSIEDQVLARERLIDRVVNATGTPPRTMPQIFIDGEHVGGYDDLVVYLKEHG